MVDVAPLLWNYLHDKMSDQYQDSKDKMPKKMYSKRFVKYLETVGRCLIKAGHISVENKKLKVKEEYWLESLSKALPMMIEYNVFEHLTI